MSEASRFLDAVREAQGNQPSLMSELAAMAREGMKDVRETVMETFLGSPETSTEPGVPLSPTMQEVTQERAGLEDQLRQYEPPAQQMERGGMEV